MLSTYFILMLDNVRILSGIATFIFGTAVFLLILYKFSEDLEGLMPYTKAAIVSFIISVSLLTFTPTTKQAALIFLSGQEDVIATAKNLPKLTKLGTDYLIELLEENKDVNKYW